MVVKRMVYGVAALTACGLLAAPNSFAGHVIESATEEVRVQIYGQVNRALLHVDDGADRHTNFVDNDHASTRFGLRGSVNIDDITAGMRIEGGVLSNRSNRISQTDDGPSGFTTRHMDAFLQTTQFGTLRLGRGSLATDGIAEEDLSYTKIIGHPDVAKYAGNFMFTDGDAFIQDPAGANIAISDVAQNLNASRDDRIRYDSPEFAGATLSLSTTAGHDQDAALRYSRSFDGNRLVAGAGYRSHRDFEDFSVSASILLGNGLSFTLASGNRNFDESGRNDANYYYSKIGYQTTTVTDLGITAVAVDYSRHQDFGANGRELDTYGIMAVQALEQWGTDLYAGFRKHDAELETGPDPDDINVFMTGIRVAF